MKRIIFLLLVVMATMSVDAQEYYRSTGNNVNIRKGPGKTYAIEESGAFSLPYVGRGEKAKLLKGDMVKYLGKKKNGYMFVEVIGCAPDGYLVYNEGWVYGKYITNDTLCPECNGKGQFEGKCQNEYHKEIEYINGFYCPSCSCKKCGAIGWY